MPRPDKRFVRYPRQGASNEPEAEAPPDAPTPPPTVVKGRHMVVPRSFDDVTSVANDPAPKPSPRHPIPGGRVSKYEGRPTSGAVPAPERTDQPAPIEPAGEPLEPAAAAGADPAMEVVFDLRESDEGFEATYWKRQADRPAAEGDHR